MRLENENNMFSTNGWAVFKCHDYSIELQRVVITSHQNLSAGKCFERQEVLKCVGEESGLFTNLLPPRLFKILIPLSTLLLKLRHMFFSVRLATVFDVS